MARPLDTFPPLVFGGRSLHSDPSGKPELLKTGTRVVLLSLALSAAGLRAQWMSCKHLRSHVSQCAGEQNDGRLDTMEQMRGTARVQWA